jgi:hypothetical protein
MVKLAFLGAAKQLNTDCLSYMAKLVGSITKNSLVKTRTLVNYEATNYALLLVYQPL